MSLSSIGSAPDNVRQRNRVRQERYFCQRPTFQYSTKLTARNASSKRRQRLHLDRRTEVFVFLVGPRGVARTTLVNVDYCGARLASFPDVNRTLVVRNAAQSEDGCFRGKGHAFLIIRFTNEARAVSKRANRRGQDVVTGCRCRTSIVIVPSRSSVDVSGLYSSLA